MVQGLPEPFAKRTVEGDLGIRFNAATILGRVGLEDLTMELRAAFPRFAVSGGQIAQYIDEISQDTSRVPSEEWHYAADAVLARVAVDLAMERHVGKRERIFSREGETWVHYGKDMTDTPTLIGTGGVFLYNPHVPQILSPGVRGNPRYQVLRPKNPKTFIDASYLLYAVGLLAESHPAVAVRIFHAHMSPVASAQPNA
jgi:uncharacterized protein (TIGR01319 family)